jgi:hypothetical protein
MFEASSYSYNAQSASHRGSSDGDDEMQDASTLALPIANIIDAIC